MNLTLHKPQAKQHRAHVPPSVAALIQALEHLPTGELFTITALRQRNPSLSTILFQRYSTHPSLASYRFTQGPGLGVLWGTPDTVRAAKEQLSKPESATPI